MKIEVNGNVSDQDHKFVEPRLRANGNEASKYSSYCSIILGFMYAKVWPDLICQLIDLVEGTTRLDIFVASRLPDFRMTIDYCWAVTSITKLSNRRRCKHLKR